MVPYKPEVQEWWQDCKIRHLVLELKGFKKEENPHLPDMMLKYLSRTHNFRQTLKQGKKKQKKS